MKNLLSIAILILLTTVSYAQTSEPEPQPVISLKVGETVQLANLNNVPVVWLPLPGMETCASVSNTGLVTALRPGVCGISNLIQVDTPSRIKYSAAPILIRVELPAPVATRLNVESQNAVVSVEGTIQLTATVYDQYDRVIAVPVGWRSSDPSVLTVDESGLATGKTAGSATVNVFYPIESPTISHVVRVMVQ